MSKKSFHLSDILSVSTGCLVSRNHMGGVHQVLNHMTGDNLFTHQLPFLEGIPKPSDLKNAQDCDVWVGNLAAVVGEWHAVESAEHLWVDHDAMSDLADVLDGKHKDI
jgi:hypothetical protein